MAGAERVDVVVVGAGIVGLATARAVLARRSRARVVVLEKEPTVAAHQSGHNSGVIHAGVYYRPGTAKARLCGEGRRLLLDYCRERGIPHEITGKLVVATSVAELGRLDELLHRCRANGLAARLVDRAGIAELEPHVDGLAAIHVPETGITDFAAVSRALAEDVVAAGAELRLGTPATGFARIGDETEVHTPGGTLATRHLVTCAGLHSDRIARAAGAATDLAIVPFRGEYHALVPDRSHLVRGLVYPVPDPRLPFLGVHLTRGIDGHVHVGPNAVPALAREGYRWRDVAPADLREVATFAGTRHLAARWWRTEVGEVTRSLVPAAFVRAVQRLVPDVRAADLVRAGSGVRAQAVAPDGTLVDDFAFAVADGAVHVLNAPSPAATASLAIGTHVADRLLG